MVYGVVNSMTSGAHMPHFKSQSWQLLAMYDFEQFSNLFVSQFLHLKNENNSNTYVIRMLWALNEWINVMFLVQSLAHSKFSVVLDIS